MHQEDLRCVSDEEDFCSWKQKHDLNENKKNTKIQSSQTEYYQIRPLNKFCACFKIEIWTVKARISFEYFAHFISFFLLSMIDFSSSVSIDVLDENLIEILNERKPLYCIFHLCAHLRPILYHFKYFTTGKGFCAFQIIFCTHFWWRVIPSIITWL